jgi:hypothetical protein
MTMAALLFLPYLRSQRQLVEFCSGFAPGYLKQTLLSLSEESELKS